MPRQLPTLPPPPTLTTLPTVPTHATLQTLGPLKTLPALALLFSGVVLVAIGCAGASPTQPSASTPAPATATATTTTTTTTPVGSVPSPPASSAPAPVLPIAPAPAPPVTISAVGDIGMCGYKEVEATARLIRDVPGPVLALGDLAYMTGSADDFARCYDPFYGSFRDRTFPVPGNHEYGTAAAAPYFAYFGTNAGTPGEGYYSYTLGSWLVVALNSNIPMHEGSAQAQWLRTTLARHPSRCTLAYWHHPLVSSGKNGDNPGVRPLWRILMEYGADVVLSGHDHTYERFAPQDEGGRFNPLGMRLFIAGTGGAYLYDFTSRPSTSEVRAAEHGVLRMTLGDGRYDWEFAPIEGKSFRDGGQDVCH